jgi:HD-GYP domain-containing protein (c-di-GMP phosphodiesterase class II)
MTSTIAVEELRVGMYIHLEGGWLSHPFPLSAFRLSSLDEIATLRRLGLREVRWVPARSDLAVVGLAGPAYPANDTDRAGDAAPPARAAPPAPPAAEPGEDRAAQQRREWLTAQREAAQRCERQYTEAAKAWREATEGVASQPQQAGRTTLALTQAMLDKMLAAQDVGIRLVGSGGDRAAAHALNVAVVSMLIGRTMGLADTDMLDLGVGALLHDVGKQDLPDRLRQLEDGFNAAEINGYRDHVARGLLAGQRMGLTPGALAIIGQHHENADGSGFPLRITADRMSHGARIVAIVNRYDKLCNPATRAVALTPHEAVAMLFAQSRSRFDPPVLNAFIRMMGVYPAGSLVQLTDDRYGMVVGVNSSRPLKPRVLVHGAGAAAPAGGRRAPPSPSTQLVDLEVMPDLGIRRSLPAAKVPPAVLAALDPRPRVAYYFEPLSQHSAPMELAA